MSQVQLSSVDSKVVCYGMVDFCFDMTEKDEYCKYLASIKSVSDSHLFKRQCYLCCLTGFLIVILNGGGNVSVSFLITNIAVTVIADGSAIHNFLKDNGDELSSPSTLITIIIIILSIRHGNYVQSPGCIYLS